MRKRTNRLCFLCLAWPLSHTDEIFGRKWRKAASGPPGKAAPIPKAKGVVACCGSCLLWFCCLKQAESWVSRNRPAVCMVARRKQQLRACWNLEHGPPAGNSISVCCLALGQCGKCSECARFGLDRRWGFRKIRAIQGGHFRNLSARSRWYARFMGLVLTDISAIEIYRRDLALSPDGLVPLPFGKTRGLDTVRPCALELRELDQRGYACLSKPVHVLVPRQTMRLSRNDVVWHVQPKPLPKSGMRFYRSSEGVFLAAPELSLLHYTSRNGLIDAIAVAFELCGSYRLGGLNGFSRAVPLTSPKSLKRFASGAKGATGVKALRRVADYVLADSASPMETALAMLLSLPCLLGGYGLPAPQMNARIEVVPKNELSQTKRYYKADLYWPSARFAIEYDSDLCHVGSERIEQDAARRNALLFQGINVVTVGRRQIMSEAKMDDVAKIAGRALGKCVRPRAQEWCKRNRELRLAVLPQPHYGAEFDL